MMCFRLWLLLLPGVTLPVSGALTHQVYVWQRAWTGPVQTAVRDHAREFSEVAVLAAEVSWKSGKPNLDRAAVDYRALSESRCAVGIVIRIGPRQDSLARDKSAVEYLARLAELLVAESKGKGVRPVELQLDFDCATANLDDYREWLAIIQKRLAPLPVTVTALPDWLDAPAFLRLAAASKYYVLQVHSLKKPVRIDEPCMLCDPTLAMRAVAKAEKLGVPFRLALPTYSYVVAFGPDGKFHGLTSEAGRGEWPPGTQLREMAADPVVISGLVSHWTTNSPRALRALIWYRLPVASDNLNWRWPTLGAIIASREPREKFHASARHVEEGLVEISLINDGELDISSRKTIEVRWSDARRVAADGLRGFEMARATSFSMAFQNNNPSFRLRAGDRMIVGWLRLDKECEVQLEVKNN